MAQETNQQQGYTCTGDCLRCSQAQRQYCASQFTYRNMRTLEAMEETLEALSDRVKNLSEKLNAIQNAECELFDPASVRETSAITASGV